MTVRPATADEHCSVMRIVDGAMLETDAGEVRERIENGDVLVAEDDGRILGAAVLEPCDANMHIEAIAVRRARRARGIGSALVGTARERYGGLTAEFDPNVRPFYESLGFDIEPAEEGSDDRFWGTLEREY
ncbi:GNAT family N-acetyltransferase [Haladaptatus caseinilyticus]|uniref:GNAT family N-acetyltransferase n=1 Tax=Haladaptatus caseinilyticus TaxID=2993314 RepID=UPI00224A53D1|nr:GNAT family N-acetyltransferase [Haladaptatus caseinilyticus]